jgi:proteasome assembly chaperone (PAC2) family protein
MELHADHANPIGRKVNNTSCSATMCVPVSIFCNRHARCLNPAPVRHADHVDTLVWHDQPPRPLRSPILVAAFEGLFDVGGAATGAIEALRLHDPIALGSIDPDPFFDFSERRPEARITEVGKRVIDWPENRVDGLLLPGQDRDLVLMQGVEPHLLWRTFADDIVEVVNHLDVAMVVTLGAMIAEVPHTRPPTITGSTADAELAGVLRLDQPTYEGPTGVIGVVLERLESAGVPAVSLRAGVPHYVSGSPNPKASRALLERFERVTGLPTRWSSLDDESRAWELRVNEAMDGDDDITQYVRRLEQRFDARTAESLPNADDLAAEFQRFLRQHGDD